MTRRHVFSRAFASAVLAMMVPDAVWAGQAVPAPATPTIAGDVARPVSLAPADLKAMPRTRVEVKDDLAFLESLTDEALLRDPRFADPWVGRRAP